MLVEAQPQLPELGVWFEGMTLERPRVRRERRGVAFCVRLARGEVVLLRRERRLRWRGRGACAQRRRCSEAQGYNSLHS